MLSLPISRYDNNSLYFAIANIVSFVTDLLTPTKFILIPDQLDVIYIDCGRTFGTILLDKLFAFSLSPDLIVVLRSQFTHKRNCICFLQCFQIERIFSHIACVPRIKSWLYTFHIAPKSYIYYYCLWATMFQNLFGSLNIVQY